MSTAATGKATLVYNGRILASPTEENSRFTWLSYCDGVVTAIGDDDNLPDVATFEGDRMDLSGRRVLPGLIDSHIHVYWLGKKLLEFDSASDSVDNLLEGLKAYASQNTELEWVVGSGWEQDLLGRYLTRFDLDKVISDRPAVLWRTCYHICVLNSKALEVLGISDGFESPAGGVVDTCTHPDDASSTTVSGILRETACELLAPFLKGDLDQRAREVARGLQECLSFGITCVQTNDAGCWPVYKHLCDVESPMLRVQLTILYEEFRKDPSSVPKPNESYTPLLSCDRVKLFADGSLGAGTAALSKPYTDEEHKCAHDMVPSGEVGHGVLIMTQPQMNAAVLDSLKNG